MIKEIQSKTNRYYKELLSLKDSGGKSLGLVLVEGIDLVTMALESYSLKYIITYEYLEGYDEYDQYILSKELYRELSSYKSLPRVMGVAEFKLADTFGDRVIYLDGIQDPGNYGTIVRTALAFGYSGVALSKDSVSPYNSKAVQATKGALFDIAIGYAELTDFSKHTLYLTVLDGEILSEKVSNPGPFVLVFGNEGTGIRKEHLTLPGQKVKLDMANIDSLNVAIAAGIFMFLFKE